MALGVHNYQQSNNAFMPLFDNFGNPAPPNGPNINTGEWPLGWAVGLLPFIEQTQLYNSSNYSGGATSPLNQTTVSNVKVAAYVCPSESVKTGPWVGSTWINYRAKFRRSGVHLALVRSHRADAARSQWDPGLEQYLSLWTIKPGAVDFASHRRNEQYGSVQRGTYRFERQYPGVRREPSQRQASRLSDEFHDRRQWQPVVDRDGRPGHGPVVSPGVQVG